MAQQYYDDRGRGDLGAELAALEAQEGASPRDLGGGRGWAAMRSRLHAVNAMHHPGLAPSTSAPTHDPGALHGDDELSRAASLRRHSTGSSHWATARSRLAAANVLHHVPDHHGDGELDWQDSRASAYVRRADLSLTNRGDAAATTWIFR